MKRALITSALISSMLALSAGSAMASDAFDGPSEFSWVPQTSVMSRAQVGAELAQAQRDGLVQQHDAVYPKAAPSAQLEAAVDPVTPGSVGQANRAGSIYFGQ
ncbi:hypothetical protein PTE30175_04076 [Pandoraea terrae]|uniref:DUF4148 domain-containing protein n=1 Tax=Pandoraea terrae TaxID=1537710 RepID=A0A5E4XY75_9BURK|nr:DUF4148 domain-containing protein [Pandoraea terrae]VVE41326.1 hypothetical protein PTE30175_04076 [Pandoraea terrae]